MGRSGAKWLTEKVHEYANAKTQASVIEPINSEYDDALRRDWSDPDGIDASISPKGSN
jgi:hypothetical protein